MSSITMSRAVLLCAQMLPATLIVPAIRPWFASHHAGNESAMHAFMSVNMFAAALVAPLVVTLLRRWSRRRVLRTAATIDAVLLALFAIPMSTNLLLVLRTLEGAAHLAALVALLSDASDRARRPGGERMMAAAGAGLVAAISFGSLFGTVALAAGGSVPFLVASALAAAVAWYGPRGVDDVVAPTRAGGRIRVPRRFVSMIGAAFVSRFAVGSLVVTFALFAHRVHGLSDREIGLCYSALTIPFALTVFPLTTWCRRIAPRVMAAFGVVGFGLAVAALAWVPTGWLMPTMIVGGLASAAVFGAVLVAASEQAAAPHERAHAMAMINGAGCLGMVLGPTASGIISAVVGRGDPDGYRAALMVAGALALLWLVTRTAASWLDGMRGAPRT